MAINVLTSARGHSCINIPQSGDTIARVNNRVWAGRYGSMTMTDQGKMVAVGHIDSKTAINAHRFLGLKQDPSVHIVTGRKYLIDSWLWYSLTENPSLLTDPVKVIGTPGDVETTRSLTEIMGFSDWKVAFDLPFTNRTITRFDELWGTGPQHIGKRPLVGLPAHLNKPVEIDGSATAELIDPAGLWKLALGNGEAYIHNYSGAPITRDGRTFDPGVYSPEGNEIYRVEEQSYPVCNPCGTQDIYELGVTLLGSGNVASPDKGNACFAVHLPNDQSLLVDFGVNPFKYYPSGSFRNTLVSTLKAAFLTHTHYDHISNLAEFAGMYFDATGKRLPLYVLRPTWSGTSGNFGAARILQNLLGADPCRTIHPIILDGTLKKGDPSARIQKEILPGISFSCGLADHEVPTMGFLEFSPAIGTIGISSDTKGTPALWKWIVDTSKKMNSQVWCSFSGGGRQSDAKFVASVKEAAIAARGTLHLYHTPRREAPAVVGEDGRYYPVIK